MLEHRRSFPNFAGRLKQLRRTMGVKQLALAQMLEVDQTTVSRWESGVHIPDADTQHAALTALNAGRADDSALRRLVENSSACVHLVDEATHTCLAYSRARARDWGRSQRALLGVSLWQFATDEIREAEAGLAESDWWMVRNPAPRAVVTSRRVYDELVISGGGMLWERLYLADGTPVRLVSGT